MAHSAETRRAVRSSYVFDCLPLEDAAARAGVSYNTARVWKKKARDRGDDWDKARDASTIAKGGLGDNHESIVHQFVRMFNATIEAIDETDDEGNYKATAMERVQALTKLSDAYTKFMKAAGGGDGTIAELSVALKVLEEQSKFVLEQYRDEPEKVGFFVDMLDAFGQRLQEVFG